MPTGTVPASCLPGKQDRDLRATVPQTEKSILLQPQLQEESKNDPDSSVYIFGTFFLLIQMVVGCFWEGEIRFREPPTGTVLLVLKEQEFFQDPSK